MQIDSWTITGDGFHFGEQGLGQEKTGTTMPSDSLFAALLSRLAVLQGAQSVQEFVAPFLAGEPPFVLSSAFPFAGGVRFYPAPARVSDEGDGARAKDLKMVKFISEGLFRQHLGGTPMTQIFAAATRFQDREVLVDSAELDRLPEHIRLNQTPLWALESRPRVTLGRSAQIPSIFFTGRVSYAPECGLWFGVHWLKDDPKLALQMENLWAELGDAGLGAERSIGFGYCRIEKSRELSLPDSGKNLCVTLSRFLPRADEMAALHDSRSAYRIVSIGGWLDSPIRRGQRRRPVNLLQEGAVLGPLPRPAPGRIEDVRPRYDDNPDPLGHPVYRSGIALAVGLQGGG